MSISNTDLIDHLDSVDASVFSGDLLYIPNQRTILRDFVNRWAKAIADADAQDAADDNATEDQESL